MDKRIFSLDFVRAISILMVIIFHYNHHALELGIANETIFWKQSISFLHHSYFGVIGVSLFIILSGASMMQSTKERLEIKTFFKKRFYAIYPLFWGAYVFSFALVFLIHHKAPVQAHPTTALLTIIGLDGFLLYRIHNFYMVGEWFLGFIIIMYLIFPFLRRLFLWNQLLGFLFCIAIVLLADRYNGIRMDLLRFPPARLLEFIFGMTFIYLFNASQKVSNCFLALIAGILFFLTVRVNMPVVLQIPIEGICFFTLLACISSLIENAWCEKPIRFLSRYSYGAFLVHHVLLVEALLPLKNSQLNPEGDYLLFFILLTLIYLISFVLTNATAFGVKKLQTKLQMNLGFV